MLERASTIVVPVDFSAATVPLLRTAANLARIYGASLHMLHVYQDVFSVLSMRTFDLSEDVVEQVMLREIEDRCNTVLDEANIGAPVERALRKGETAEEILTYVKEVDADMIVIATNARSGLEHFFIGSIAQRVVRYATCPVVTLRAATAE